jgi:hypothetical protein
MFPAAPLTSTHPSSRLGQRLQHDLRRPGEYDLEAMTLALNATNLFGCRSSAGSNIAGVQGENRAAHSSYE